jgi:hypothetical protein
VAGSSNNCLAIVTLGSATPIEVAGSIVAILTLLLGDRLLPRLMAHFKKTQNGGGCCEVRILQFALFAPGVQEIQAVEKALAATERDNTNC